MLGANTRSPHVMTPARERRNHSVAAGEYGRSDCRTLVALRRPSGRRSYTHKLPPVEASAMDTVAS